MRNCIWTRQGSAPTDLRMPISRVRSCTDTSIMFMIPIPPTSSAMPPSATVSTRNVAEALCDVFRTLA